MRWRGRWTAMVVALAMMMVLVAPATAQTDSGDRFCDFSDLRIHIENPDLRIPFDDGLVVATGNFLGQARIVGEGASEVATVAFHFSLAEGVDEPQAYTDAICTIPSSTLLQAPLQYYREDSDPSDGFFINFQTYNVPDALYFAVLSAYDSAGNELARSWSEASVENCAPGTIGLCEDAPVKEIIDPWPRVLPGDGVGPETGLTVEILEEISELEVYVDGVNIADELEPWEGVLWDTDLIPQRSPAEQIPVWSEPCTGPGRTCEHVGVAFRWPGPALADGTVINVFATDPWGNVAYKTRVVGQDASGTEAFPGAFVAWQIDHVVAELEAGSSFDFTFNLTNFGTDIARLFPSIDQGLPVGWEAQWDPSRLQILPEEEATVTATVMVPEDGVNGTHSVDLSMDYESEAGVNRTVHQVVRIDVFGGRPAGSDPGSGCNPCIEDGHDDGPKSTPSIGMVSLLVALALFVRRRN